jgi:hypothetical protein
LQGELQQLVIAGNPEAAYDLCTDYVPDCNNGNSNNNSGNDDSKDHQVTEQLLAFECF